MEFLTNKEIKNIIKEQVINTLDKLNEDRTELDDGSVEIDNFDTCANLMKFDHPGDTIYFVKIIKRDKDNPGMKSTFGSCTYLKEYYFKSIDEFMAAKDEIKMLCKAMNGRAYIHLNPRSKTIIDKYTQIELNKIAKNPYLRKKYGGHEMALAAGRSFDTPDRPICLLDIDTDDMNVIRKIWQMLKEKDITPLTAYRSLNNGLHLILPDVQKAKELDLSIVNGKDYNKTGLMRVSAPVCLEIDLPAILYCCLKPQGYDQQVSRYNNLRNGIRR